MRSKPLAVLSLMAAAAWGQSTQGTIRGRIVDSLSRLGVGGAIIETDSARAEADAAGYYALPPLSPGNYTLRVGAAGYQAQQMRQVELAVASQLSVDFELRPLADVWDQGSFSGRAIAPFFGPDIERRRTALVRFARADLNGKEPTLSDVVTLDLLRGLPLSGRDAYALLALLPGVGSEAGTARGLGVAVHGQRPSASNFLLDGVENNNYLVTGALVPLPPEALSEYRLSISHFSAEYGRTSGFLANAVTRSGSKRWHWLAWLYGQHEALNANGFQQNRLGVARDPLRQWQPGAQAGGTVRGWQLGGSFEALRSRNRQNPVEVELPSARYRTFTLPDSAARRLLDRFAAPLPDTRDLAGFVKLSPPVSLDRTVEVARADRMVFGQRVFLRWMRSRLRRPDFLWSPYPDFVSPLRQDTYAPMVGALLQPRPAWQLEMRLAWAQDTLAWDRPHPEIPTLTTFLGEQLPGSPAFYAFANRTRHGEFNVSAAHTTPRHSTRFGAGLLPRRIDGELTAGRDGQYLFGTIFDFYAAQPDAFQIMRAKKGLAPPNYAQQDRLTQVHAFAQDAWRVNARVLLTYGTRYESFGAPGGLYQPDRNNFAARLGLSARLGRGLLRLGTGTYFDRPFDNLWRDTVFNGLKLASVPLRQASNFPFDRRPGDLSGLRAGNFPSPVRLPETLRDPYAQSSFAGYEVRFGEASSLEVRAMSTRGRKLIATDKVRRETELASFRGNQGSSAFHGWSAIWRYRSATGRAQVSYTGSRSVDVQSEPLAGEFFDLAFTRAVATSADRTGRSAFQYEGDSHGDRGFSDFDQRHNLTWFALWQPRHQWEIGMLGAWRSGLPFTVFGLPPDDGPVVYNARALWNGRPSAPVETDGGRLLLDPLHFANPVAGGAPGTRRNPFRAPGSFSLDASLARRLAGRGQIRIEAFNVLNYTNLGAPENRLNSPEFGLALRGRAGRASTFPALLPFSEQGRRLQILVRWEFGTAR